MRITHSECEFWIRCGFFHSHTILMHANLKLVHGVNLTNFENESVPMKFCTEERMHPLCVCFHVKSDLKQNSAKIFEIMLAVAVAAVVADYSIGLFPKNYESDFDFRLD